MERRREDRRENDERRTNEQAARPEQEREVTALGRSVDLVVHEIGQSIGGWWAERDVAASVRQVTFEDDDPARWKVTPANLEMISEDLRPTFD